jgi:ribosome maturation factor RimP
MQALREIEERLSTAISGWLEEAFPHAFLVEARLRVHRPEPEVYLRVDTDTGITLDQCVQIHLFLKEKLEGLSWLPENYTLSVSSPGLGSPLRLRRQFPSNIGRLLSVRLSDGRHLKGTLAEVTDTGLLLRTFKGEVHVPWENLALARVELPKPRRPTLRKR